MVASPYRPSSLPLSGAPPGCHVEAFTVRSYDLDWSGRLALRALGGFFQEAARVHAAQLGLGHDVLSQENLAWALTRLRIVVDDEPELRETVVVTTWPSGRDRLYAYRDFTLTGADGRALVRATSAWVLFDVHERKAHRMNDVLDGVEIPARPRALELPKKKPPELERADAEKHFRVRLGDLDPNGHTNNGRYMEWMLESLPSRFWGTQRLAEIDLLFREEALYDDAIVAECQDLGDRTFAHRTRRARDGLELARASSRWIEAEPPALAW
jgi:medium-chain acyl-[acyl-carrier-protein] hydrolase